MNQKIKSITASLILLILFTFTLNYTYNFEAINYCNQNNSCILKLIEDNQKFSLCKQSENINKCYYKSSIKFNQSNLCNNLTINPTKCFHDNAIYHNSLEIGHKSGNLTNQCIFELAIKNKNLSYCNNSDNKYYCYYSYAVITQNSSICNISEKYKKVCYDKIIEN